MIKESQTYNKGSREQRSLENAHKKTREFNLNEKKMNQILIIMRKERDCFYLQFNPLYQVVEFVIGVAWLVHQYQKNYLVDLVVVVVVVLYDF